MNNNKPVVYRHLTRIMNGKVDYQIKADAILYDYISTGLDSLYTYITQVPEIIGGNFRGDVVIVEVIQRVDVTSAFEVNAYTFQFKKDTVEVLVEHLAPVVQQKERYIKFLNGIQIRGYVGDSNKNWFVQPLTPEFKLMETRVTVVAKPLGDYGNWIVELPDGSTVEVARQKLKDAR